MSDSKVSQAHQSKEYKEGKLKAYSRKIKPSWYSWISAHLSSKYFFHGKTSCKCQSFSLKFGTCSTALSGT